jgi:hypothetical protein
MGKGLDKKGDIPEKEGWLIMKGRRRSQNAASRFLEKWEGIVVWSCSPLSNPSIQTRIPNESRIRWKFRTGNIWRLREKAVEQKSGRSIKIFMAIFFSILKEGQQNLNSFTLSLPNFCSSV